MIAKKGLEQSRSKEACRHEEAHTMADKDIATTLNLFHRFYISSSAVDYNSAELWRTEFMKCSFWQVKLSNLLQMLQKIHEEGSSTSNGTNREMKKKGKRCMTK
ncbi:hypothetical protein ACOSQ2_027517 [Xanthoceras sorbifolium]